MLMQEHRCRVFFGWQLPLLVSQVTWRRGSTSHDAVIAPRAYVRPNMANNRCSRSLCTAQLLPRGEIKSKVAGLSTSNASSLPMVPPTALQLVRSAPATRINQFQERKRHFVVAATVRRTYERCNARA